jgi:hypothetical protein
MASFAGGSSAGMDRSTSKPRLSDEETSIARFGAAGLQVLSGVLAILSVFIVWWIDTAANGTLVQDFPGSSFKTNATSSTYASAGYGQVGGLFEAILVLGIVGGILLLVGGILMLVSTARRRNPQNRRMAGLVIAGIVLLAAGVVAGPVMLPWAVHASSAGSSYCSGWTGTSPCNYDWGSGTHSGVGYRFVMANGWIAMIIAMSLSILGIVIWRLGRNPSDTMAT